STQNLQTFLRRKYLRPASRAPGPVGPPGRGPRDPNRVPPSARGASVRGACPSEAAGASGGATFVSSAMMLLEILRWLLVVSRSQAPLGPGGNAINKAHA